MAEKLYTTQELADNISVSRSTIYRFLKVNQIQPVEINGRSKLYSKDTLKQARRELLLPSTNKKTILATEAKHLDQLQQQLELINEQLREKDRQIAELHQLIDHQQKLTLSATKQLNDLLALQETDPDAIKIAAAEVQRQLPENSQAQQILYPTQGVSYKTTNAISTEEKKPKKRGFFSWFRRNKRS